MGGVMISLANGSAAIFPMRALSWVFMVFYFERIGAALPLLMFHWLCWLHWFH